MEVPERPVFRRKLDGIYRTSVHLIWDTWKNHPWRLPLLLIVGLLAVTSAGGLILPPHTTVAETGSASAARLYTTGFELQDTTAGMEYTANTGSPTISTSTFRSGAASLETSTTSGTAEGIEYDFNTTNVADGYYMRAYVRFATLPNATTSIFEAYDNGNTVQTSIQIKSDGTLQLCNIEDDSTCATPVLTYSTALTTGTWYRLELKEDSTTIATTKVNAKVDGVAFGSDGSVNHANGMQTMRVGFLSTAHTNSPDAFWDDLAVNSDSSTDVNNGNYPGEGKVVILRPNGDGTNKSWKDSGGTACSSASPVCYTLVDETPPNTSDYIKATTTGDIEDFDFTSSSSAGIGANDTIRFAQGNIRDQGETSAADNITVALLDGANVDTGTGFDTGSTWNTNGAGSSIATTANPAVSSYDRPGTGTTHVYPWTPTTIDSIQLRLTTTDIAPIPDVTAVWINVEYISATGGRLFSSGFENQSVTAGVEWTAVTNTPAIDTTTFRSGAASLRATGWTSSTAEFLSYTMKAANADGPFYLRTYLRITTMPASGNTNRIISFRTSGAADMVYINLLNSGALQLFDEDGQVGSDSSALSTGTWYRIEIQMNRNGGSSGTVEAKIDGATAFATSSSRSLSSGVDKIVVGANLGTAAITAGDWYFDDVAVNENVGSSQTSYPGRGKIIHLRPNGDGNTVTWTNTSTSIDETTPNDATDSVTSTTLNQIEEATITDATANGVASTDTINLVSVGVRFNSGSTAVSGFKVRVKDASGATPLESDGILNNSTTWKTNIDTGPLKYPVTAYTRPDRTDAWTPSTVDAAQIGVRETTDTVDTQAVSTLWLLVDFTPPITVSGNAYADEATTAWVPCDDSTANISLVVNGGTAQTVLCADSNGAYTFNVFGIAATNPVSVFFNTTGGNTDKGVAITVAANDEANITLNPRKNIAWVKSETGISNITNGNMDHCDSVSPSGCANVPYDVTSGALTVTSGVELHVESGKTFAPGGDVSTPKLHVPGTYTGGSETLTISGTGTGTARPFYIESGTFTASSNTVTFTGQGATEIELGGSYNNLNLQPTSGTETYTLGTASSQTLTINGNFTVNNGATLTIDWTNYDPAINLVGNLTLNASTTWTKSNSGTFTFKPTGTKSWTDNVATKQDLGTVVIGSGASTPKIQLGSSVAATTIDINSSHELDANGTVTITLTGTSGTLFTKGGTFTQSTSNVTITSASGTPTLLSTGTTFHKLTINAAATSISAGAAITMSSADANNKLDIQQGTLDDGGNQIAGTANGTMSMSSGTTLKLGNGSASLFPTNYTNGNISLNAASTVIYNATVNQTISSTPTYGNVQLSRASGTPTKSLSGTTTIAGSLTIDASNTLDTVSGQNHALSIGSNYTNNGTFTAQNGTVTFTATTSGKTLSGTLNGSSAFYNLIFSGTNGEWTPGATVAITSDLTMTAGSLLGTQSITVSGGDVTGDGTINLTGGTFTVNTGGTFGGATAWTFSSLSFGSGTHTPSGDGGITISSVLTLGSSCAFQGGNKTWTLSGTTGAPFAGLGIGATFTAQTSTFVYSGNFSSGNTTIRSVTYNNLTLNNGSETYVTNATQNVSGDLTITAGTLDVTGSNFALNIGGNYSNSGTFSAQGGTVTFNATDSGNTLSGTMTGSSKFNNLTFNGINGAWSFGSNNGEVGADLTITNGTLTSSSGTLTITGNYSNSGTFTNNSGLIKFNATDSGNTLGGTMTGSSKFHNLTFDGVSGAWTFGSNNGEVANNLTITNGTLTGSSGTLTITGDYTNNGAFTHNSGTVTLNGTSTQTLSGTMTGGSAFSTLTITNSSGSITSTCPTTTAFTAGVSFAASATFSTYSIATTGLSAGVYVQYNSGSTYTVTNISWVGTNTKKIYFRNSNLSSGTWLLNYSPGSASISYVDVSRSDASGGTTIPATDGTNVNCDNNTNWNFGTATYSQEDYRFAQPNGLNVDYTGAPAADNAYTTSGTGDDFRLRLLIHVAGSNLAQSGKNFKLQFGEKTAATCASGVSWGDVATGSGVIRYYDGGGRNDGDTLTTNAGDPTHGGDTVVGQTYEEANNFTNSVAAINAGQDGLWDFSLVNNSAVGGKKYCFQVTESDGTALTAYNQYPEVVVDEELIFTLDATSKDFGVVQPGANPTNVTSTLTTTTNSSTGYVVYAWATQAMTLTNGFGTFTITDWTGTNASPTTFGNGSFGFGYTTDDSSLTGGTADRFTNGGAKYAGFVNIGPGDPVADRTSGPVSAVQDNITYRLAASASQAAGTYNTVIVYVCSVTF